MFQKLGEGWPKFIKYNVENSRKFFNEWDIVNLIVGGFDGDVRN